MVHVCCPVYRSGRDRQWTITANDNGKYFNACLVSGGCRRSRWSTDAIRFWTLPQVLLLIIVVRSLQTVPVTKIRLWSFVTVTPLDDMDWYDLVNLDLAKYVSVDGGVKRRRMTWRNAMHQRKSLRNVACLTGCHHNYTNKETARSDLSVSHFTSPQLLLLLVLEPSLLLLLPLPCVCLYMMNSN